MNANAIITTAEPYRFQIGQTVDHIGGKMRSIIVDRYITMMGRENYHIVVSAEDAAGRPLRIVAGTAPVAA